MKIYIFFQAIFILMVLGWFFVPVYTAAGVSFDTITEYAMSSLIFVMISQDNAC